MMLAWSFAVHSVDDVARLLRALGKHRYVAEVDHRLHWAVDRALDDRAPFAAHASALHARLARDPDFDIDLGSRHPALWRPAGVEEVIAALTALWSAGAEGDRARRRLEEVLAAAEVAPSTHPPFGSPPDDPPHPELVLLDWVLLPVDELDTERHAGALAEMEESGEEIDPSASVYQEGPTLAAPELVLGASGGALVDDFLIWSDGPYSYTDYVFRGASKAAKLVEPPIGLLDF
jgi:hypothetical protein